MTTLALRPPPQEPLPRPMTFPQPSRRRAASARRDGENPPLPARRTDLIVRPLGDDGGHVVKDPRLGAYYNLGAQESFLFARLDGRSAASDVRDAFARQFGEELSASDLQDFLAIARDSGFIEPTAPASAEADRAAEHPEATSAPPPARKERQSLLYWRRSIVDPDRLFNVLAPRLRFLWTRAFFVLSAIFIGSAMLLVWVNARELVTRFPHMMRWETFALAWLTLIAATTLHEFAHGLTCKHFGGEVHEVGFLAMFFIPCLYCNVSDAWLFREKSKRVWVTLAGGYFDLLAWAAAAFTWRLTAQDTLVNYLAFVVLSVLGLRNLFNFNPLIKLDGYYLLSDVCAIPNLRQRAWDRFMSHARWLLWGGSHPAYESRGRFLLAFGTLAWAYSLMLVLLIVVGFLYFLRERLGDHLGVGLALMLGVTLSRSSLQGLSNGEFRNMITTRFRRTAVWAVVLVGFVAALFVGRLEERAHGSFQVRSVARADVRAPVTGLLQTVKVNEGDRVAAGDIVIELHIPDLETRLAKGRAEILASEARVRMLAAATRHQRESDDAVRQAAQIDAERAYTAKVEAEVRHLEDQKRRLSVRSPVAGLITTPRLRDRVGEHVKEGDLICAVADPAELEIEIAMDEQEVSDVRVGQRVQLKARALPYETFQAQVQRIAPAAVSGDVQSKLTVYCVVPNPSPALRPGMSGHARISCGARPAGLVLFGRVLRTLRTEFWW